MAEVQFAAEKQNPDAVVGHVAEASGRRFQGRDLTVEALAQGIGDPVQLVGQQPRQIPPEGFDQGGH